MERDLSRMTAAPGQCTYNFVVIPQLLGIYKLHIEDLYR